MDKYKYLIGQKFGELTVIDVDYESSLADPSYKVYLKCKCSCGNEKSFRLNNLKNGHTKSCGCKKHITNKDLRSDLVGKRFGRLTVVRAKEWIEYKDGERKELEYFCDCDCGTKNYLVSSNHLKNGDSRSCGCLQRELVSRRRSIDLTGKKFGRLTVLYRFRSIRNRKVGPVKWICRCECGNIAIVPTSHLTGGHTNSCGCLVSKNEEKIIKLLHEYNIKFKNQFSFNDLRGDKRPLRFDFAIYDKDNHIVMFIEYDGEQHFQEIKYSSDANKNKEKLIKVRERDRLKNEYCKQNGFSLLRIPYICKNDVEDIVISALKEKGVI